MKKIISDFIEKGGDVQIEKSTHFDGINYTFVPPSGIANARRVLITSEGFKDTRFVTRTLTSVSKKVIF